MKDKLAYIPALYYVFAALCYAATLLTDAMRPGIAGAVLIFAVLVSLIASGNIRILCLADAAVAVLFFYQVLSVIWLMQGGYPLSVYTSEFVSSTFPMVFYFAGRSAGKLKGRWYGYFAASVIFLGVLGIVLYAFAPQFYCDWAYRWSYISKPDASTARVRMHSVIGSTCLSFLSVSGILAGSYFLTGNETGGRSETGGRRYCLNFLRQYLRPPV
ncbi:MAG: hypothetical protein IKO16_00545, partial [Lachnospiraceae bacterium]|nr:hypothetical protein [Lachnospiraceae bacterium]